MVAPIPPRRGNLIPRGRSVARARAGPRYAVPRRSPRIVGAPTWAAAQHHLCKHAYPQQAAETSHRLWRCGPRRSSRRAEGVIRPRTTSRGETNTRRAVTPLLTPTTSGRLAEYGGAEIAISASSPLAREAVSPSMLGILGVFYAVVIRPISGGYLATRRWYPPLGGGNFPLPSPKPRKNKGNFILPHQTPPMVAKIDGIKNKGRFYDVFRRFFTLK